MNPPAGPENPTTEIMMVPDKMVGLIIGRGGEQITRLQAETACKIQMAQDSNGMPERQCTLSGMPSSIQQAKEAINKIIANEGTGGAPGGGNRGGAGFFEMMVPGHKVGLVIGKGGEMIKQMQEQSGAKIVIIQESSEAAMEKPLRITGTPEAIEMAKGLVNEILNQVDERDMSFGGGRGRGRGGGMMRGGGGRGGFGAPRGGRGGGMPGRGGFGGGGWNGGNEYGGGQSTDYIQVPANKIGLVIGKGGETIKQINSSTGAHCEIDRNAPADAREKNFIIRGPPDAVERAKSMIMEKLGMGGFDAGGAGGYGGSTGTWGASSGGYQNSAYDSGNAAAATGQADYSQQWAEYYRSMGMTKEAEAIEATRGAAAAQQAAAVPQPANGAPQNGGGGADYSAQWAEYYRSIGKVKEAEAIENQMKQKVMGW